MYSQPAVPQLSTPHTASRKSVCPIPNTSLTSSGRGPEIPGLLRSFWSTLVLPSTVMSSLRSGEVHCFNRINLDRVDSATAGYRICLLLDVNAEDQIGFALIQHVFSCHMVRPSVLVVVPYFDNLADVTLKSSHKHFRVLRRAHHARLARKDHFVQHHVRLGHAYVTFKSADGPPVYELVEAVLIIRRCRMWKDTSHIGPFPCFYAHV